MRQRTIAAKTFCPMVETEPGFCFKYAGANCRKASATEGMVQDYFNLWSTSLGSLPNIVLMTSRELASAVSVKCK